ncbi:uncharacterized protein FFM5_15371 [Fusarium fujikuroi]|nr:uncharacterized protein FFM5_15371 [Fusarium fujikuroi]
MLVAKRS